MATTEAVVTVGTVTVTDNEAKFIAPVNNDEGVFNDYVIENRYVHNRHTYMLGITSPGGFQNMSTAFVCLASPTMLWIADWTALRTGKQPPIPDPERIAIAGWVFLFALPVTRNVAVASDGLTPMYRISGTYIYGKKNPEGKDNSSELYEDVSYGRPPWLEDFTTRKVDQNTLTDNLIEALE